MMFSGRRQLIPIQLVYFVLFSGLSCLTPFLTPHLKDIGLTYREAIVINTAAAFLSIFGPLLFGAIADRHARYKECIVITLFFSAVAYTGLLFIPRIVRSLRTPAIEFDCPDAVRLEKCANWNTCSEAGIATNDFINFTLTDCQYHCINSSENTTYPLHLCFQGVAGNICMVYNVDSGEYVQFQSKFMSGYYEEQKTVHRSVFLSETTDITEFVDVCNFRPVAPIVFQEKPYQDIQCRPIPEKCTVKCYLDLKHNGRELKPAICQDIRGNPILTFWAYLGLRCFADFCIMTSLCLIDAVTVASINDFYGLYGRMHVWAALGLALISPLSGALVDYYSQIAQKPDYSPSFFIFDGLVLISCALIIFLPIQAGSNARYVVSPERTRKKMKFCNWEMAFLIVVVLMLGTLWGYNETFMHWSYVNIGCDNLMLGCTMTIAFLCSLPFLVISKNMVRNIGRAHLIVFAFLFYGIRYAGISFVTKDSVNPWWILPFEAMETFTLSVAWIGIVAYAQSMVPRGTRLKVQYLFNLLHFCAGRGLGTAIGGLLSEIFGIAYTYRGFAIFSAALGFLYLTIYHTCLKRCRQRKRPPSPVVMNGGSWYPLGETRPNGDARRNRLIGSDQEDSDIGADDAPK